MPKFRKRPIVIEAVQLNWANWSDVCELLGKDLWDQPAYTIPANEVSNTCGEPGPAYIALKVTTVHGEQAIVRHGDWIIPEKEVGRFYPCKPDVFAATYEPVT
jgi:hypothetical protein